MDPSIWTWLSGGGAATVLGYLVYAARKAAPLLRGLTREFKDSDPAKGNGSLRDQLYRIESSGERLEEAVGRIDGRVFRLEGRFDKHLTDERQKGN